MSAAAASLPSENQDLSVDELEAAITRLAQQMNAECYRMLVLVREFDERLGGYRSKLLDWKQNGEAHD